MKRDAVFLHRFFLEYGELNYNRWKYGRKREKGLEIFEKLIKRVEDYERKNNKEIDLIKYIKAHYKIYKKYLYPSQLLSKNSFDIYFKYIGNPNYIVVKPISEKEVREEIEYLADIWSISVEKAIQIFDY